MEEASQQEEEASQQEEQANAQISLPGIPLPGGRHLSICESYILAVILIVH